jgi:hypothetical protein
MVLCGVGIIGQALRRLQKSPVVIGCFNYYNAGEIHGAFPA